MSSSLADARNACLCFLDLDKHEPQERSCYHRFHRSFDVLFIDPVILSTGVRSSDISVVTVLKAAQNHSQFKQSLVDVWKPSNGIWLLLARNHVMN